jgi:hypothetical protein
VTLYHYSRENAGGGAQTRFAAIRHVCGEEGIFNEKETTNQPLNGRHVTQSEFKRIRREHKLLVRSGINCVPTGFSTTLHSQNEE